LTVLFTLSGTATLNTDYSLSPFPATSVTFAAGQSTVTKTLMAPSDALIDDNETVVVTLATGGAYTIGSPSAATVTIIDATRVITVMATDAGATEGRDTGTVYIFSRTEATGERLHVTAVVGTLSFPECRLLDATGQPALSCAAFTFFDRDCGPLVAGGSSYATESETTVTTAVEPTPFTCNT
jgi:hypothetical protein